MSVLSVADLTVRFGGLLALDGVTFDVSEGSILGIIGPNGAGKSTLFDAISGLVPVESGRVVLAGDDVSSLSAHERARRGLGRSFQDGRMFPSLTVEECVGLAMVRHVPVEAPVSVLTGGPLARSSLKRSRVRTEEVLSLMGLDVYAEAYVRELSTGTRRIVELACTVAHAPKVLLLDEPSSGVAQAEVASLGPLLQRVRAETNCTMLLIEHDIPLVTSVSDELLALETGKVLARGTPDEVIHDPEVVTAYLGTDKRIA